MWCLITHTFFLNTENNERVCLVRFCSRRMITVNRWCRIWNGDFYVKNPRMNIHVAITQQKIDTNKDGSAWNIGWGGAILFCSSFNSTVKGDKYRMPRFSGSRDMFF